MSLRHVDSFSETAIERALLRALAKLVDFDKALFLNNASERSICHRLALYLEAEFPDFDIDCEYNRDYRNRDNLRKQLRGEDLIRLAYPKKERATVEIDADESITVFPDIIVHRRNTSDNLLVIETKKTASSVDDAFDRKKLVEYQSQLGYRFAKFLRFGTTGEGKLIDQNVFLATWNRK